MIVLKASLTASVMLFVTIFFITWLFNHHYTAVSIPLGQIAGVSAVYILYFLLLTTLFWSFARVKLQHRLSLALLYIGTCATVVPTVDYLVYTVFPIIGVQFFDESIPRDDDVFHYTIWRGYVFINAVAAGFVILLHYLEERRTMRRLAKDLDVYRKRIGGLRHTSHFLASVFAGSFGRMLIEDVPKDKQGKRDIIQFLGYLMKVEDPDASHEWDEEIDQLSCFVRLIRMYYGSGAIDLDICMQDGEYPLLPWGVLLFPLENCLRHAWISADHPIDYRLTVCPGRAEIICSNYWSPKQQEHHSGTGFGLLEAKVSDSVYALEHRSLRRDGKYKLILNLNWDSDEEISLPRTAFG